MMRRIPRAAIYLGFASLFTDLAAEAVYPHFPSFLTTELGATLVFVGIFEGMAELTAAVFKFIGGWASDRTGSTKTWVLSGYAMANTWRPLIGLVSTPIHALGLRMADRIGKGIRTATRDRWLSEITPPEERGRVFGFHRAMDHLGGVLGPLFSIVFLWVYPGAIRELFLVTLIPGLLAVVMVFLAPATPPPSEVIKKQSISSTHHMSSKLKRYLLILGVFAFANSSDAFLLLRFSELGATPLELSLLWMGLHAVMALTSSWGGVFSDQRGRRRSILLGWGVFIFSYLGMAHVSEKIYFVFFFLIYGLFSSLTESAEKALVAEEAPVSSRGKAYGTLHLINGVMLLPASLFAGWIAQVWSLEVALKVGASVAAVAALLLAAQVRKKSTAH
jgi:MFS family permease